MDMRLIASILLCLGAFLPRLSVAAAGEETAVVTEHKINVRGQPSLVGEVITQLQKGDTVTILERVKVEKPKPGEPTNWAKIKLPANTPVWVFAPMVKDGSVASTRLNLRAGPGENYSVIGRLNKGDAVKPIRTVEQWTEIEAPADAYAFVDAGLLDRKGSEAVATTAPQPSSSTASNGTTQGSATPPAITAPTQIPIPTVRQTPPPTASPTVVAAAGNTAPQLPSFPATSRPTAEPETAGAGTDQNPLAPPRAPQRTAENQAVNTPTPFTPQALPKVAEAPPSKSEQPPARRVIRREGIIRATKSIQAPTWYELIHPQTKKTIDFLNEEKLGVKLKDYKGQKVVVTGEEGIDPRWPNTPILEIETLDFAP